MLLQQFRQVQLNINIVMLQFSNIQSVFLEMQQVLQQFLIRRNYLVPWRRRRIRPLERAIAPTAHDLYLA